MSVETVTQADVEALRQQVGDSIEAVVAQLKGLEKGLQERLREATVEQQHLLSFLDELNYRLSMVSLSHEPLITITGPLTDSQILAMHSQEETLQDRKEELIKVISELEQIDNRLTWLVHQIEGACEWVTTPAIGNGEDDTEGERLQKPQPSAGEQVMWAQVIMGQEHERARLAREIHDGPAQVLANTVMRLQFLEQLQRHQPEEVPGEIARLRGTLQASMKDMRRFIFNLRPASLADAGLLPTLRQYLEDYSEQTGIEVELNLPENLVLSANQELVVFRIVQEALQNVRKHAEATRVEVSVQQRPDGPAVVTISDNGKGFDPRTARRTQPGSSGLVSMKERAATVGGTLKIESHSGVGTTITLVLATPKA